MQAARHLYYLSSSSVCGVLTRDRGRAIGISRVRAGFARHCDQSSQSQKLSIREWWTISSL